MPDSKARVLVVAGYFDWFSGYQETVLTRALSRLAHTDVLAGNRVSPIFSDDHLRTIGQTRVYAPGTTHENDVSITRLPVQELRSMVYSPRVAKTVTEGDYDLVIQVMPGQFLPAQASLGHAKRRISLYGDNAAMYAGLSRTAARAKFAVFAATKGLLYFLVNSRADAIYGYTGDTVARLRRFNAGKPLQLLPLAFDNTVYSFDPEERARTRKNLGISEGEIVIVAAGKVQPQKRLDSLVDAAAEVRKTHPNLRLVLVGMDTTVTSKLLLERIDSVGLSAVTITRNFVPAPELNSIFNASDVGVWPAMPAITIQQAMGTGLTVVIPSNGFTSHLFGVQTSAIPLKNGALATSLLDALLSATSTLSRSDRARSELAHNNSWLCSDNIAARLLDDCQ